MNATTEFDNEAVISADNHFEQDGFTALINRGDSYPFPPIGERLFVGTTSA